jgi:hypothetical protein
MHPTTYQFLVEDRLRTLDGEAQAARLAALARQASKGRADDQSGRTGLRFEIVRRLVARLAAA